MNPAGNGNNILIVDDIKGNIDMLQYALKKDYKIITANDGASALEEAKDHIPDLILMDIMMPRMDGYEACKKLKEDKTTRNIPVIFITAMDDTINKTKGFKLGAVDYITKPFDIVEVKARIRTHLALKKAREELLNQNEILEAKVRERTRELNETRLEIVFRLGRAAEYRDNETGMHIKRISHYCETIGRAAGLSNDDVELLLYASPMHDVGKIGIPDSILLKPGRLDAQEFEIMKTHTTIGGEILSGHNSEQLRIAQLIALSHHEKWDGTGYPRGLKGAEIPVEARITAICDVFDALISERSYKTAWPLEEATFLIKSERGRQFDPILVDLFEDVFDEIVEIKDKFPDKTR